MRAGWPSDATVAARAAAVLRARAIRSLRSRLDSIARIDFFQARGRETVNAAIGALEGSLTLRPAEQAAEENGHPATEFLSRRWVTRPRPSVDRMSSAWLIRRFIDPLATFGFTLDPSPQEVPSACRASASRIRAR